MSIEKKKEKSALNSKVGKKFTKCVGGKLCYPQDEFDVIESCKGCKKML